MKFNIPTCAHCQKWIVDHTQEVRDDRGRLFCTQDHADRQFVVELEEGE